ncbi:cytochrome c oxidase subunit II [Mesohalobacter halotolerans]|uniref:cytochrome-c oxidase n=1 Tax=Mesohalobacter halotolerans TaxID=1883405 RepID=A0A4U5TNZ1_9FLAO|nr:cytochrome c oxidase subunit II [Mesohalobacter halotolerans]MBS3738029.1 cytochrome c oxidase subunit II [Psychroflexus sp.]TKS55799.1 cytochrome c oxidase subunit II [Mesohalobacter halotolerans]
MTAFLIIIVLALLAITAWQISKIYKLSRPSDDDGIIANDKDNQKQAKIMLVFMVFLYGLMIYSFWNLSKFYLPEAASEHGSSYDQLMFISIAIIMIVQVVTQALLHYFAYKYRGKKGKRALFYADNNTLEFVWTVIPVVVLAGLIIYGLVSWTQIMNPPDDEDTLVVEIYAYQFDWRARYSGQDNVLGKANVRFIEGVNQLGVDETDEYGKDDVIVNELHLPVDKPVIFKFRSQDVLHSAYFPFFRSQMNVVPGMITEFSFTPTTTSKEIKNSEYMLEKVKRINEIRSERSKDLVAEGRSELDEYEFDYYLLCNKICGVTHYNMQMKIVVEEEEEFNKWMEEQQTFGELLAKQ